MSCVFYLLPRVLGCIASDPTEDTESATCWKADTESAICCIASDPTEDTESFCRWYTSRNQHLRCIASDPTEDTESTVYHTLNRLSTKLHRLRSDRGY